MSKRDVIRRWPRLVAHLICHSLGYFTPDTAAVAISHFKRGERVACEWYYHIATQLKDQYPDKTMQEIVLLVGQRALVGAIKCRHRHNGSMADYKYAMALVTRVRNGKEGPELASWF